VLVLKRHNESAGVFGLVRGQVLQDLREGGREGGTGDEWWNTGGREGGRGRTYLGQGAQELKQALLETGAAFLLLALHEVTNNGLGLAQAVHGEGADLEGGRKGGREGGGEGG